MRKIIFSISILLSSIFSFAQQWKEVGPIQFPTNSSGQINGLGRVTQLKFHPTLANKIYATSASGGLYMTTDTGHHWQQLGTDNFPVCAMASVCIDYTNDQILYVSTGDPNYYGIDLGIYKTVNGGASWNAVNTGLGNLMALDILMNPTNNQEIVIATNNGIWKTINGANSWTNVKSGGAFTHMIQVPNTTKLFAVTNNSQVWMSVDFGNSWTQNTSTNFSQANADGMRVCVNNVNPNIIYIASNGNNGVIYKSNDGGTTFNQIYSSTTQCLVCYDENPTNAGQGNYDFAACNDPLNPNHLYVAAHCLWESNDGGISWDRKTAWPTELHTDHHQFIFSPYNNTKFWSANDGGVWLREGLNDSLWQPMCDGITAMEMYHAAASPLVKKLYSAGTQDNGEVFHDATGWYTNRGGDWGSRMEFDYSNERNVYYLETGDRRSFNPNGYQSYNSPFTETNNSRIAFSKAKKNVALLSNTNIYISNDVNSSSPTWTLAFTHSGTIRDLVISSADTTVGYAFKANSIIRLNNLNTTPTGIVLTLPASAGTRGSIATVKSDVNVLYASCNAKMFRSIDQGVTWTNITYNLPTTNILKIYHDDFSTNETIYVCSGNTIFTKQKTDTVWQNISMNLPSISNIQDFMFYNDSTIASKLIVGYYGRGLWEYLIHPSYPPVADFSANNTFICSGSAIQFNNLSAEDNLTYSWSFTGGTPSTSTLQNPTIVYNTAGIYPVTLTATNANGSNTKTINSYIQVVANAPAVDTLPSNALQLNGTSISHGNAGPLNLNSNHVTLMCWIKPNGVQNDWAGLMFARGNNTTSGVSIKSDNEIRYHWAGNNWWESTGLYAIDNQWNHIALVITPNDATIYVNGIGKIIPNTNPVEQFDADMIIGADMNGGPRYFKGLIDEACIYNRALSQNEIREQMHLIKKNNVAADSLVTYWQMNALTSSYTILNKANCEHQLSINSSCNLVTSTAPLGKGTSERKMVTTPGNVSTSIADMNLEFPSTGNLPDGEICITHLNNSPDQMPNGLASAGNYWIVDNYGTNATIGNLSKIDLMKCGYLTGVAIDYKLYNRGANDDGATWSSILCSGTTMTLGANGNVNFDANTNVNSLGQFVITGPYFAVNTNDVELNGFSIYPNPTKDDLIFESKLNQSFRVKLFTLDGKLLTQQQSDNEILKLNCANYSNGIYFYQVICNDKISNGKFQILK